MHVAGCDPTAGKGLCFVIVWMRMAGEGLCSDSIAADELYIYKYTNAA